MNKLVLVAIFTILTPTISFAADNTLWGFHCTSTVSKTVANIAIKENKVISVTVHPEVDGQINYASATTLHEVGQNRYSSDRLNNNYDDDDDDNTNQLSQNQSYEVSFSLVAEAQLNADGVPKIQEASLKEGQIAPSILNCSTVFEHRTRPAIFL